MSDITKTRYRSTTEWAIGYRVWLFLIERPHSPDWYKNKIFGNTVPIVVFVCFIIVKFNFDESLYCKKLKTNCNEGDQPGSSAQGFARKPNYVSLYFLSIWVVVGCWNINDTEPTGWYLIFIYPSCIYSIFIYAKLACMCICPARLTLLMEERILLSWEVKVLNTSADTIAFFFSCLCLLIPDNTRYYICSAENEEHSVIPYYYIIDGRYLQVCTQQEALIKMQFPLNLILTFRFK